MFDELDVPLKDYYMFSKSHSQPSRYNDITKLLSDKDENELLAKDESFDPFRVSEANGGPVPEEYVASQDFILRRQS